MSERLFGVVSTFLMYIRDWRFNSYLFKVEIQVSERSLKLGRDPSHPMKLTIYFLAIVFLFLPSVEKASAEKTGLC